MSRPEDDHHYDDFDDYDPDEDDGFDECGMTHDGFCTLAGSEWCDWECPRNRPRPPSQPDTKKEGA